MEDWTEEEQEEIAKEVKEILSFEKFCVQNGYIHISLANYHKSRRPLQLFVNFNWDGPRRLSLLGKDKGHDLAGLFWKSEW